MQEIVQFQAPQTAVQMKAHTDLIREVVQSVMKDGVHYGKIPGTDKPTLYKSGAEILCATFHISPTYDVEDLCSHDEIRYRVTCIGTHQGTGTVIATAMGECSSNEGKYKWRKPTCDTEFDNTPEERRRLLWRKGTSGDYSIKQVRTEIADIANTIIKMANKRAQVAMILNAVAASDVFSQDMEDMPEELRGGDDQHQQQSQRRSPQSTKGKKAADKDKGGAGASPSSSESAAPKPAAPPPPPPPPVFIGEGQLKVIRARIAKISKTEADVLKEHGIEALESLTLEAGNALLDKLR